MRRLICLALSLALMWGLVAAASSASAPTAAQLLATALRDAEAAGPVHEQQRVAFAGSTSTMSADAGRDEGVQRVAASGVGRAEIRLVAGTASCRASSAHALLEFCAAGPVDAKLAGHWIRYPRTSNSYATIATGLTLASQLGESTPTGPLHLTATRSLGGTRVIGITGAPPAVDSGATTLTMWVTDSATPLPLEADLEGSPNVIAHLSRWGEKVAVSAPQGAVEVK